VAGLGAPIAPVLPTRVRRPQPSDLDVETAMGRVQVARKVLPYFFTAVALLLLTPVSRAQTTDISGRYQCTEAKMKGKLIACNAAPLILKNDGRFELRGWEGKYLVSGEWVELSDSLIKTRAKIQPGHKIVLKYIGKHGLVEMTYERRVVELGKTALS